MKTAKRILVVLAVVALLVGALAVSAFAANADDFNTVNTNTGYGTRTTTNGWKGTNCAVLQGGSSDSNPTFKFIGSSSSVRAFCMNGKTSAKGSIQSPTLTGGIEKLTLNYGLPFSDTKIKFTITITDSNGVTQSETVQNLSATKLTVYSHTWTLTTPVTGDFTIGIVNDCPSNKNSNGDRTAIWNIQWVSHEGGNSGEVVEKTDADKVADVMNSLTIDTSYTADTVVEGIHFWASDFGEVYNDVDIAWSSDSANFVFDDGEETVTVTIPKAGEEDEIVTVKVQVSCNGEVEEKTFTVTLVAPPAAIEGTWALVTDASTLKVGDKIVIVAFESDYAMGTDQGNNNRAHVAITKGDGVVSFDETVQIIILEAGSADGTFAFKTEEGYLFAAGSSNNYLKSQATINEDASWTITVSSGTASIVATNSSNRNVMQYNPSSFLFSCYASATQKPLAIYKLDTGSMSDEDKIESVMGGVSIPEVIFTAGTQIALPSGNNAVSVNWALSANDYAAIVDGKLVVNTLPAGSEVVTLTATATCGSATVTKTYNITLKTLTQAEIVDMAFALASGATLENGPYTLTGVISEIVTAYNSGYKNITVNITVYGTDGVAKTMQCYRLSGVGADAIKVGDEITVTGSIKNHNGTIEFDAGCTLVKYPAPVSFNGVSLNIKDNIDVYYYVAVNAGFKSASVNFTFNGETTTVSEYKTLEDGRLMFVFEGINPAQLGDAINATVSVKYVDNTYTATNNGMSIKKYYQMAQNYEGTKNDTALMTLLSDLLVYGAAAQEYSNYKTDALVTEGLELTPSANAIPESVFASTGDAFKSVALELGSDVTFVIGVALEGGDVVTVKFNGITTTYAQEDLVADENGIYTIKVANVFATDYADVLTAEVNGNTLTYSVNSYINEKQDDDDSALAALVTALNNYGASAVAYKNA